MAPLDSLQLLDASDLRDIFADALTSFSPLATLVGSDSARAFIHEVTNTKQILLANIAPIGALGMMATVCKGSQLPGIKDMLGVGNADIYDAAADLGCYTLFGIVPQLTKRGGLSCRGHQVNRGVSACAVVKQTWKSDGQPEEEGEKQERKGKEQEDQNASPDFEKIGRVAKDFRGGTVTGRMVWECSDAADYQNKIEQVHAAIMTSFVSGTPIYGASQIDMAIFKKVGAVKGGVGMLELHWPAPAMVLETNGWICYVSNAVFLTLFCAVAIITASPLLGWQSPLASAFLVGGQIMLTLGHTFVHVLFRRLRRQSMITIPKRDVAATWTLVDNTWFVSTVARRPISLPTLDGSHITLGQYISFKRPYLPQTQALLGLFVIAVGFIVFYVGARSSDFRTVLIFIFIFLVANCTKGFLINYANRCYYAATNNFGYLLLDLKKPDQDDVDEEQEDLPGLAYSSCQQEDTGKEDEDIVKDAKPDVNPQPVHDDGKDPNIPHRQNSGPVLVPQQPSRSTLIRRHSTSRYSTMHSDGGLVSTQPLLPLSPREESQEHMLSESPTQLSPAVSTHSLSAYTQQLPFYDVDSQYFCHSPNPLAIPLPPSVSSLTPSLPVPDHGVAIDIQYRVYTKFAVRHREALGMFYYSRPEEWAMIAHIVFDVVRLERPGLWGDPMTREYLCQIPFEFYLPSNEESKSGDAEDDSTGANKDSDLKPLPPTRAIAAMLLLILDETRFEDPFWSAGQEITSIIMEHFIHPTELPSESRRATELNVLCLFVYILTKILLTSGGLYGSRSLMRAIDLARAKRPYDDSVWLVVHLRQAAENAAIDVGMQYHNNVDLNPDAGLE
ncbi:hypothetical protein K435DRAFT_837226 [Dendrothele bispora CBS 962.96]|uniref:Uncharacterized protein n=1 Tax=Dendrothele bispora (strain CBS 962.96) TaxID=1314807 RepID=A0A4S8MDD5_DENBC|nr:hypothetical protein K435DRAFT_837226 [Dendrothele bispora CBS 962.96]